MGNVSSITAFGGSVVMVALGSGPVLVLFWCFLVFFVCVRGSIRTSGLGNCICFQASILFCFVLLICHLALYTPVFVEIWDYPVSFTTYLTFRTEPLSTIGHTRGKKQNLRRTVSSLIRIGALR